MLCYFNIMRFTSLPETFKKNLSRCYSIIYSKGNANGGGGVYGLSIYMVYIYVQARISELLDNWGRLYFTSGI
jgi:hypothetical protein